jgi:RNA polymerase sigma factor (sigma-70 family)
MENMFGADDAGELSLIDAAQDGERSALEALIRKHQDWIYNITLRMVGNPEDAEDVTQEVIIKLMTRLSSFEKRSSFRTWAYRIAVNHVLTMRRRPWERMFCSFERHADLIESLQEMDPGRSPHSGVDEQLLLEETRTGCVTGMLLCLDRSERIALILGSFFDVSSELGGELLETTPANFRQILSRARKRLGSFMNEQCGLMNEANSCRCARKIHGAMQAGLVDPRHLRFNLPYLHRIREFVAEKAPAVDTAVEMKLQGILRDQPLYASPDCRRVIDIMLRRGDIGEIVNFNEEAGPCGRSL